MFLGSASKETPLLICKLKDSGEGLFVSARGRNPSPQLWLQFPGSFSIPVWEKCQQSHGEKKLLLSLLSQTTDGIYFRADCKMCF